MRSLPQDLRHCIRQGLRKPGFTLIAVLTLALGIGANSAIFSVVSSVLLKPLGYHAPQSLILITSRFPHLGFDKFWVSPPEYLEFKERNRSFETVGAFTENDVNLSGTDQPVRARVAYITAELFTTLGIPAELGRTFIAEEDVPGAEPVIVLSHELWTRAFGGAEGLVGETVEVGGIVTTVVGIMPPRFDINDEGFEAWLPLRIDPADPGGRGSHFLYLIGRLKEGVDLERARADVGALVAGWGELNPGQHAPSPHHHPLQLEPLKEEVVGEVRPALLMLLAAVGFVLLIACANVANLLLVQAEGRRREIAVRTAIGAGRGRLLRQFITEGLVLAFCGGLLGTLLGLWSVKGLLAIHPESLPRVAEIGLDAKVLLFSLALSLFTGLIFGLAPALHLTTKSLQSSLKDGGRSTHSPARNRLRRILVAGELALAFILVVLCGLMLKGFWNLLEVDVGFEPEQLTTFQIVLPSAKYPEDHQIVDFYARLEDRLANLPGVEAVATMSGLPPKRRLDANDTDFEGLQPTEDGPPHLTDYWQFASPSYFSTMGIEVLEGETFSELHTGTNHPVVVINETLAKTFWPDQSPLGKRLRAGWVDVPWRTVIGVVEDVKHGGIDEAVSTEVYFPIAQSPDTMPVTPRAMHLLLKSSRTAESLAPELRREVRALDPSLPIAHLQSLDEVLYGAVARPRFLATLLGIFAALALTLAAIGTYGVLAFTVMERRQEIGIRMALGARASDVKRLILGQGMKVAAVGLALGGFGAYFLSRSIESLFFQVSAQDPAIFFGVLTLLVFVALLACLIPAQRATQVDPMLTLRED